jgi:hypothetical protein
MSTPPTSVNSFSASLGIASLRSPIPDSIASCNKIDDKLGNKVGDCVDNVEYLRCHELAFHLLTGGALSIWNHAK